MHHSIGHSGRWGLTDASLFVPLLKLLRAICDSEGGDSFVCPPNVVMDVYDPSGGGLELDVIICHH